MNTAQRQTQINDVLANQKITKNVQIRQLLSLELSFLEVAQLTNSSISLVKKIFLKYWPEKADLIKFSIKDFDVKFIFRIEGFGVNKDEIYKSLIDAGLSVNKPSNLAQELTFWNVIDNKSIVEYKSFEVKSPIIKGIEGLNQIKIVLDCLKKLRMKTNDYCSIHIHFLTAFTDPNHLHNAVINYIRYENVIDKFHKPCRRLDENPYCKSLISYENALLQIGNDTQKLSIVGPNQNHKLNFPNKIHLGTICFSHQNSTTNYTHVENWIVFLDNLFQFSKFEQVNTISANIKSFEKFVKPSVLKYFQKLIKK
ncbi:amidoligase family protein [Flectobacillus sp. BAB-3569]|uniref:amidoligase family protein n=1 Tax=Flectobacillus sp. BAB-3569 TaxID=1509483 RepID=UPI000BA4253A|nr:amidoligase family protein [Flectobacillus sp. BAB-3569]PAC27767.1 hypothetical protein BWI92_21380 [Flectobacillus sp. BAB-3569]